MAVAFCMRTVTATFLLAGVLSAPWVRAAAGSLTCDRFKQKLSSAIEAGGNLVAQPIGFAPLADNPDRQFFKGIVGLDGSVDCLGGTFFSFGATAYINASGQQENLDRNVRIVALASAAICAVEALPPKTCFAMAEQMHARAVKEFTASVRRGDPSPAGVAQRDLTRTGADAQFEAEDNATIQFSLNISPKTGIEDLKPR